MLRQTPLFEDHRAAGARLTDFAGWAMPLHYGSQLDEHHAVRRHAGMFDVSHMLAIDVVGPDAEAYLRRLLANDVARLAALGRALYSCLLDAQGGVLDDVIAYRLDASAPPERFRVVVNAGRADADLDWMQRQANGFALELHPRRDLAMIALQGPAARALAEGLWPTLAPTLAGLARFGAFETDAMLVARTGYTGEDGYEIMLSGAAAPALWRRLRDAGVRPCGLGARDTLRLEAGMNLYGQDMDTSVTPAECGLSWTVAFTPGRDFIGRAALESKPPNRQQLGLVLLDRGVLRAHQRVLCAQGEGETTSGGFAPTLNGSIALARLPLGVAPGDTVRVQVRDKSLAARVVRPPFVRHGQVLV